MRDKTPTTMTPTAKEGHKPDRQDGTIRLIYPQWQGADIVRWIPEVEDEAEASRGYCLGAQLLEMLAPENARQETCVVPVSGEYTARKVTDGVLDKDALLSQTRCALQLLRVKQPRRIITLGGECAVSVVPFTYLAERYGGDVAMIWIDAHPDITLPGDVYAGYHAMAVTACMGKGDKDLMAELPAVIPASNILLVGLRDWERDEIKVRQQEYGISHLAPEEVSADSHKILDWLRQCGASKVVIHFDLDVLDPAEIIAAVGVVPGGLKMKEVVRIINDITEERDVVGLTVAEPMPRTAIRLRQMLGAIRLFGNDAP